jgi:Leucine-rich repeat (LRR) protein
VKLSRKIYASRGGQFSNMAAKGVVDLSFNDLADGSDIDNYFTKEEKEGNSKSSRVLREVKAIRLGNNLLSDTGSIGKSLSSQVDTERILWIDLSFNKLSKISEELQTAFPNVTTLYLQANQISRLSEIKKLGMFKNLKSLTLFGNPVEGNKHYRNMVLYSCPNLHILDFCPITPSQRKRNDIWSDVFRNKLNPGND